MEMNEYKDWERDKIEEEKWIVAKYPFLQVRDSDGNIDTAARFPLMCLEIPDGWHVLFYQMCDEIKPILEEKGLLNEYYFIQVKEKFNRLVCYANMVVDEVEDIISKYEIMARYICVNCGRPAVFETTEYIASYCDSCFKDYVRHDKGKWIKFEPQYVKITWRDGRNQEEIISFEEEWDRYLKENGYERSE